MSKHYLNQKYLHKWEDYINALPDKEVGLLPLWVDIDEKGIQRSIISKKDVAKLYSKFRRNKDIPDYMFGTDCVPNIEDAFKSYIKDYGGKESPGLKASPLDIVTPKPIFVLYMLSRKDSRGHKIRFTEAQQFSCVNDMDDMTRNVFKVCTVNDYKGFIMYDSCRSNPQNLKYNLHVTITQKITDNNGCKVDAETPIIIDPGIGNKGSWPN